MSEQSKSVAESGLPLTALKPPVRLLIWRLAAAGGGEWVGAIHPSPSAAVRKELMESGLAQSEARKNPDTGRQGIWVELTEAGWSWTSENMGEEIGGGSAAADTLSVLLKTLDHFLAAKRLTAEEVFRQYGESTHDLPDEAAEVLSPMVEAAIVRSYLRVTGGSYGIRVLLTQLRPCVELSPGELDSVLRSLAADGRLELAAIGETELTAEDRQAALRGFRGEFYHAVCLDS